MGTKYLSHISRIKSENPMRSLIIPMPVESSCLESPSILDRVKLIAIKK
jgi:hypothetical protein